MNFDYRDLHHHSSDSSSFIILPRQVGSSFMAWIASWSFFAFYSPYLIIIIPQTSAICSTVQLNRLSPVGNLVLNLSVRAS